MGPLPARVPSRTRPSLGSGQALLVWISSGSFSRLKNRNRGHGHGGGGGRLSKTMGENGSRKRQGASRRAASDRSTKQAGWTGRRSFLDAFHKKPRKRL